MLEKIFEILHYDYALRALAASSVVGITCGILGCFVILRRMALIGDALSHAILPGVVAGFMFFGHNTLAIFAGAVVAGLFTSMLITWVQRNSITKDDASIGIVFTGMFALGIIGISWLTKREGIHLDMKDFLFGNVLGVSDSDLWLTAMIGIYVIVCVYLFFKYLFISTFDPVIAATMGISVAVIHYFLMFLLSLSIVASIQSVGVILVVAMLIIPASTAYLLTDKLYKMVIISAIVGLISASGGLLVAIILEITPGPTMTLFAVMLFALSLLFSPKRGFILVTIRKRARQFKIDKEDLLKAIVKLRLQGSCSFELLRNHLDFNKIYLRLSLHKLKSQGFVHEKSGEYFVTEVGSAEVKKLIRAHRLWETYLSKEMNVPADQLHEEAEKMEHIEQNEFWDKVDEALGFPETDPHGSPIPQIAGSKQVYKHLSELQVNQEAAISPEQKEASALLWQAGVLSESTFKVVDKTVHSVTIKLSHKSLEFSIEDAGTINVTDVI